VRDNGAGISPEYRDTLFQPFFTTKPTGKSTGRGPTATRSPFCSWGGELHLPKSPKETMLISNCQESGECRFNPA
jgi:C4-dicarboxylate-specific signal transduction histidine kinase